MAGFRGGRRRGRRRLRRFVWRGIAAFIERPCFIGVLLLAAIRDVIVAVGDFCDRWTRETVLRLAHQALQFRHSGRQAFALGLQLLAVIEIVSGGIGKRRRHPIAHIGTAGQQRTAGEQNHAGKSLERHTKASTGSEHVTLLIPQH
jgi:hypothetical protein